MFSTRWQLPKVVILYNTASTEWAVNVKEIINYLAKHLPQVKIVRRGDLVKHYLKGSEKEKIHRLAEQFAYARIRNPFKKNNQFPPLPGEVKYEEKWLKTPQRKPQGILYDAVKLQKIYFELLPSSERNLDYLSILILTQLFGTWDEANLRYHIRSSLYGLPCMISLPGLVEGPAKPREFYLKKQLGFDILELKKELGNGIIHYQDIRITEIIKGYLMQAVFYYVTGNPFCQKKTCRLYNAHWQEELITAQLKSRKNAKEFCSAHQKILEAIKNEKKYNR